MRCLSCVAGVALAIALTGGCDRSPRNPLLPTALLVGPSAPFAVSGVVFRITSGTREPLSGVIVEADVLGQTITDSDGRYDLRGVSTARRVLLTARKNGYVTVTITMLVGNDVRADFNLLGIE